MNASSSLPCSGSRRRTHCSATYRSRGPPRKFLHASEGLDHPGPLTSPLLTARNLRLQALPPIPIPLERRKARGANGRANRNSSRVGAKAFWVPDRK